MENISKISHIRNDRRRELRKLNLSVWEGKTDAFPVADNLDTSLKKNTAFTRRCRTSLTEDQQSTLLKEVATLSLEKYMSEVVQDISEGLTKCKTSADMFTGVEVVSALHQRFGVQFTGPLMVNFTTGINNPDSRQLMQLTEQARQKEAQSRMERHKIVLRVLIELWLVGVFNFATDVAGAGFQLPSYVTRRTPNGNMLPIPLAALKEVLDYDTSRYSVAPLAIMVLKNYGPLLFSLRGEEEAGTDPLIAKDVQDKFRLLFVSYTVTMVKNVQDVARNTRRMERRNEDAYIRTGRILDERKTQYEDMLALAEFMTSSCKTLCDFLGIEMPELRLTTETVDEVLIRKGGTVFQASDSGIWDDDEQRKFYEDLVNLSIIVKQDRSDLDSSVKDDDAKPPLEGEDEEDDSKYDSDDENDKEDEAILNALENISIRNEDPGDEDVTEDDLPEVEKSETQSSEQATTPAIPASSENEDAGQQMQALLLSISEKTSRETIDQFAVEFTGLNSKSSRKRLLKFLTEVPLQDEFKLPFYCRLLATLDPIVPDITKGVIEHLDDFFRYLQKKRKVKALYQRRVFNVRYISELVKFGIVPKHVIFNKFKQMSERLDSDNVQSLANLLEGCGRYLLRKPETNVLMTKMLQVLEKQKKERYFTIDQRILIDGALAYVKPDPEVEATTPTKVRSELEQFIRHLIYFELEPRNVFQIAPLLAKLDFDNEEVTRALFKVFSKIHKVRSANVPGMAILLRKLVASSRLFVLSIIDAVLEDIRRGLELNSFSMNQQRIAQVTFLGEMYRQKLVPASLIYEVLYLFITFGYPGGTPQRGMCAPGIDEPDEFFRVRLVCTLLLTIYRLLPNDSKLDLFFAFLQFYIYTKDPLSMDVQFQVTDTFVTVMPKMKVHKSYQSAAKGLQKAMARARGEHVDESDDEEEAHTPTLSEQENDENDGEAEEERLIREEQERIRNLEAKRVYAAKKDLKARAEFEREFKRVMVDRFNSSSATSKTAQEVRAFDEPIPSRKVLKGAHEVVDMTRGENGLSRNKTAYTLLTKKGAKQQLSSVSIPTDSNLAQNVIQEQERRQAEHDVIRQRILEYAERSENEGSTTQVLPSISQPVLLPSKYSTKKPTR